MDRSAVNPGHVAHTLSDKVEVIGVEFASRSNLYAWPEARKTQLYNHVTLFPGRNFEETRAAFPLVPQWSEAKQDGGKGRGR
jgi:hypothetical protein